MLDVLAYTEHCDALRRPGTSVGSLIPRHRKYEIAQGAVGDTPGAGATARDSLVDTAATLRPAG
ncbi:hypothetical protein GCM10023353_03010 [Tomitella cavernea]|uniref:Uncharacterized protein n=1 Tax=Tomitella cavernea TaxID=1387982 RepID=A0ABP9C2C9_9ACTN